jgi:hypothetical protein
MLSRAAAKLLFMAKRSYQGSCICKQIRFEADIDLSAGTGKCNCTICWKRRWWGALIKPEAFRPLATPEHVHYGFPTDSYGIRAICKECGVVPFGWGNLPQVSGDYVSINLACLDDLDPAELAAAPVKYQDGLHDAWWNVPKETRHL